MNKHLLIKGLQLIVNYFYNVLEGVKMELNGFSEFKNEMSTVFRNDDVLCTVNPGVGRIGDSYFKLYDSNSLRTATKVARIKFTEPKYVIHKDENGLQPWIFNNREKKLLIEYVNLKENFYNRELTYFQIAIVKT